MEYKNNSTVTVAKVSHKGEVVAGKQEENMSSSLSWQKAGGLCQYILRVLAFGLSLAALIVMLKSTTHGLYMAFPVTARYSYSPAFKFLAVADGVICGGSLLSLVYVFLLSLPTPHSLSYFVLFLLDLVMTLLMLAGCAAGTAIGYVGQYGQKQSAWFPICDKGLAKFCSKITTSVALSYIAFICYLLLTILTVTKIRSSSVGKVVTTST